MRELIGREGNDKYVIFSFYRSFFGNPILAMVNGVLLLLSWSMANLSRAVEREGGRKETRNCRPWRGKTEREGEGKWKRSGEFEDDGVFHGVANSYRP